MLDSVSSASYGPIETRSLSPRYLGHDLAFFVLLDAGHDYSPLIDDRAAQADVSLGVRYL